MPQTIIGPTPQDFPQKIAPPLVQIKQHWSDDWVFEPRLEFLHASSFTSGDLDICELRHRYGKLRYPWQSSKTLQGAFPFPYGWWVRVLLMGPQGMQEAWIGRISSDVRDIRGSSEGPTGDQYWIAYGPADILRKIHVSECFFLDQGEVRQLGWVPAINDADQRGKILGNRSINKDGDSYVYAAEAQGDQPFGVEWTHYQYLEYLLDRFVDESDAGGPKWTIAGETAVLKATREIIPMGTTQTVMQIIGALIRPELGIDWKIQRTPEGFAIWCYALSPQPVAFGGASLPANKDKVTLKVGQTKDLLSCRLVRSGDQRYGRIRVLGDRIIVCFSAFMEDAMPMWDVPRLVTKWSAAEEVEYRAGSPEPGATAIEHDQARARPQYHEVFQRYIVQPNLVFWPRCPHLNAIGQVVGQEINSHFQTSVLETLDCLPLFSGWDYTADPPALNPFDDHPGYQYAPPLVLLAHSKQTSAGPLAWTWVPAEDASRFADWISCGVAALQSHWGIQLSARPLPHVLALHHFNWWGFGGDSPSIHHPRYDYDYMIVTLAGKGDHRLKVHAQKANFRPSDGTLDLDAGGAELHYLWDQTVVKLSPTGQPLNSGENRRVLRNDREKLCRVMAGALSRHAQDRCRAAVTIKGLHAWGGLLGQILGGVDDGADIHAIQAPITAVEWVGPSTEPPGDAGQTIIRAGFAE